MHYSPYRRFKQNSPSKNTNQQSRFQRSRIQTIKRGYNSEQLQIQDLQEKVEIILTHNQKLIAQNQDLKRVLLQGSHDKTSKINSIVYENQRLVRSLKDQLQIKKIQFDQLNNEVLINKNHQIKELELMTDAINKLTSENQRLSREVQQARKLKINFDNMLEQQLKSLKSRLNSAREDQINDLKKAHQAQLVNFNKNKMQAIVRLEESHEKEKRQMEDTIKKAFSKQMTKLEDSIFEKCKDQREKAEKFIKSMMDNMQFENNVQNQSLKKQIEALKNSLQCRKKILIQFTEDNRNSEQSDGLTWFNELMKAKKEFAEYTKHFLRESELLKLKMSHQHQLDVKHVSKSYEAQIDILSSRVSQLEGINSDLRARYEEQVRAKLVMKQNFEIKLSQLKNLIKKLKLDLDKVSDDYRISIDGIKSSQIALSSHLIIDIQNKKVKENFYQQELKKLRHHLDKKDEERVLIEQQCEEKIKYYAEKMNNFQERLKQREHDFKEKEKALIEQCNRKQQDQKALLEKERAALKEILALNQKELQKIKEQLQAVKDKKSELEVQVSQRKKDIEDLKHKLESANAHIEALKLELEMRGFEEKNEQAKRRQSWKNHYQRRIKQLQQDKENLKLSSDTKQQQVAQLLVKYKDLESSLEKTIQTMKKRTALEKQVVSLGMDQNLVKNLAELF